MSIGLGFGLVAIAFCQIALLMGGAYYLVGVWVDGKPRAYIAALLASAYMVGRFQQAIQETGWVALSDPKIQIVLAAYLLTLTLFVFRTGVKSHQL